MIILAFNIYLNLLLQAQDLTSKNLAITLNYWQQIDGFFAYNETLPRACKIKSIINKRTILCPVWIRILINKKQFLGWQQQQKKNGFINLYLPKIGILHEKTKITKIKNVIYQAPTEKNQHLITLVYMRYAHVLKYKIKDIDTGEISEITATPEHKFYETTYNKFMAISKLGSSNTITNASNHHLKIICTNNRQNNCGTAPLNSLQKVYNMEVEKAHNYFVGNIKALVHNGCYDFYYKCLECNKIHSEKDIFLKDCEKSTDKRHLLRIFYQCEFCGYNTQNIGQRRDHAKFHKENGRYGCSLCSGRFNSQSARMHHEDMHKKNGDIIFCGECDRRISLKEKLDDKHIHKPDSQPESTDLIFRARSRSPIRSFTNFSIKFILGLD